VKEVISHSQWAQTRSRVACKPQSIRLNERLGLSPKEFSEANGKSPTWAYRQIYSGKLKVISDCGRMLIPRSEVDRFLARATEYNPKSKAEDQEQSGGAT